ncbi:hypothetical protein E1301_Tti022561 [Triplophysa tibetana]|uniref:Immunoglobulin V-set domain-containing protein n=1 Tax=Triplophysa tibetana TaxID=1572043 RepID=A0A5A9NR08_9TELE|nr:hypothetical protein E1301_Tti022561 [Triplophysa tibetana]
MNLTEHQKKQGISWKFGARGFLIAEITRGNGKVKTYEDQADGRFRDRLMLDQTGSLTITNITADDSGLYEVSNTSTNAKLNTFNITVHGDGRRKVQKGSLRVEPDPRCYSGP